MDLGQRKLREKLNTKPNTNVAKNVIIFIGDGLGVSTVTAARIHKGQLQGKTGEEGSLFFENFPYVGLSKTYNTDRMVSDSAGTATAILCGVKTKFGLIGVDDRASFGNCTSEEGASVDSILKWANAEGKSTGIITTTRITHATPASGFAHSASRYWEADADLPADARGTCTDIAKQMIEGDGSFIKVSWRRSLNKEGFMMF
ncbi:alkaline phosphatase, tissue-nonspecific isozyme-like [Lingula anatina]|uniref:Alkaline phosphatase n=1 Tax=Lingula anatina TaxID=7574 RepID=A0A1S3K4I7_LINAN|nr:alkaline phosphatase, tissue-nonspecific isozyme-like [Lingula anatina]|eukprot:XP_013417437.1 alkaline phosphatase, tissue-nonspecific isozyme-like [Lingula anatina]